MAKIGIVEAVVTSESPTYSNTITDRPVEGGSIVDHIKQNPIGLSISGVVAKDGWESLKKLREYRDKGELITYTGRNAFNKMAIEDLTTTHPASIKGGFAFTITLKQIRVATARIVEIVIPEAKTQAKPVSSSGKTNTKPKPVFNLIGTKVSDIFNFEASMLIQRTASAQLDQFFTLPNSVAISMMKYKPQMTTMTSGGGVSW